MFKPVLAFLLACAFSVPAFAQPRRFEFAGLIVFEDPDFRGQSATFREDISNLQSVGLNDRVSSLRVPRGERWEVCEDANYQGRCRVVTGAQADLRKIGLNDKISSARRVVDYGRDRGRGRGGDESSRFSIELFSDVRFSGERRVFTGEVSNLQTTGFNDKARSLRVRGNWEVCVDANYQNCVTVNRDTVDLAQMGMARRISSVRPVNDSRR